MYRAIYDYTSRLSNYMSFQKNDNFTVLDNSEKDWFLAQNGLGEVGYIPKNYVEPISVADPDVLKSIDRAIAAINEQATISGNNYTPQQKQNLTKLVEHRSRVLEKNVSTVEPGISSNKTVIYQQVPAQQTEIMPKRKAPKPPDNDTHSKRSSVKSVTAPLPPSRTSSLKFPDDSNMYPTHQPDMCDQQSYESLDMQSPEIPQCAVNKCQTKSIEALDSSTALTINPIFKIDSATSPIKSHSSLSMLDVSNLQIPNNFGTEMVDEVRKSTGLSYDKSCLAVECIFSLLKLRIPETNDLVNKITHTFQQISDDAEEDSSHDAVRLQELFSDLADCKDDSQQRSWALHEDESIIKGYLEELNSILENAKPSICRRVIARNNYECLNNLVIYYQMELRSSLRLKMLKSFSRMCVLDKLAISGLLYSVLPLELATEMRSCKNDANHLSFVVHVFSMIFCTGESVQFSMYEHLNQSFIHFVFELIESPPSDEHEDKVTDLIVTFILAFNLHFQNYEGNFIMQELAERGTAQNFSEKILILFNRGDDPVKMFDHQSSPPNSVTKLLLDLYGNAKTACLLYTNDLKVLIDIVIRQLCDLSPGEKIRTLYLSLVQLVLRNSDYSESQHRREELLKCFSTIITEEADTEWDKSIANDILEEQKNLFFYS
ncbi:hypothetical protein ScPMuIL_009656 [Solemya velum]